MVATKLHLRLEEPRVVVPTKQGWLLAGWRSLQDREL